MFLVGLDSLVIWLAGVVANRFEGSGEQGKAAFFEDGAVCHA
jgi:hypothetical protein